MENDKYAGHPRKKCPELGSDGQHEDSTPAQTALFVKKFLTSKNIIVMGHPPYSSDLASCNFFLISYNKPYLKETHFTPVEEIQAKTENLLKCLPKPTSLHYYYRQRQHRIQKCVNAERNCFEEAIAMHNIRRMILKGCFPVVGNEMVELLAKRGTDILQRSSKDLPLHSAKLEINKIDEIAFVTQFPIPLKVNLENVIKT
ncbi:DDE_3 domain-containing protein [Trichonephila clavipes]|nr:DDE_3 domain-containing protein [Trichonephila clavipes]